MIELDLSIEISGFKMKNPTMLASGILGISIPLLKRVLEAGAGGVVTKSIGIKQRDGYQTPNIVETFCGYVNAIGLSNPGIDEFMKELQEFDISDMPIIVSVFGGSELEFSKLVSTLDKTDVKGFELNLSCPHVAGLGAEVGSNPDTVYKITKEVKKCSKKPIFVKISPNVTNHLEIARAAEDGGADGIVAINAVRAMVIDIETGRPILSNKVGGLSGPAIKPIAVRYVYDISRNVKIPVIGCGGINCWEDAIEFMLAGASAIQIGTAIAYKGLNVFNEIIYGISEYLKRKSYHSVKEIIGLAHKF
ncbi:MAG: dihydroorotate dehydrogenase [Nitrososphaerales archaeon]